MDKNEIINKIFQERHELFSLPQTLVEVLRIARDDRSSADEMAKVLMHDPALTAKILRMANSPYYSVHREVTTMTKAVVMLGLRQVTALALSASIYNLVARWETKIDRLRFWRHSLEVAIASRMIAEAIQYPHIEEAFIAGLLHDIGLLILEKSFPKDFEHLCRQAQKGERTLELEEELWGTNHARVGQFLLEQWNIPQAICEAVGHHHIQYVPNSCDSEMIYSQIIALANLVSSFGVIKEVRDEETFEIENRSTIRDNLNLTVESLRDIQVRLLPQTVEEARYLDIEIGSVEEILSEANCLLTRQYLAVETLLCENRRMQQQIARNQMKEAALETLRTITATFNHYINNATATILGRAQLVELAVKNGVIPDHEGQ
ncbi:MAG: HDOD domain-containing protein, partial [candidate division Zixibacteria bacterium]|nr:HDOD domain-containing protein [candidate division Zixibacteria bacterium]